MNVSVPSYFEHPAGMVDSDTVPSGTYLHMTCTRNSSTNDFRHWTGETDPALDDAYDNAVGLICNDGIFVDPAGWPAETECEEVPTCTPLPTPPATSLLTATNLVIWSLKLKVFQYSILIVHLSPG